MYQSFAFYVVKYFKIVNFSGRAAGSLTLEKLKQEGYNSQNPFPYTHGYAVTVPGAAASWVDTVDKFGSQTVSVFTKCTVVPLRCPVPQNRY